MLSPGSPLTPVILGVTLVALVALLVVRALRKDRLEYRRFKRFRSTVKRQRMYRKWLIDSFAVFGGASVVTLALSWQQIPLFLDDVHAVPWVAEMRTAFTESGALGAGLAAGIVVALVGGAILAIVAARHTDSVPSVGDIQALLPRNREELRYGALLSVNAGVVEELLFRLALPAIVFGITGNAAVSIVASLAVFGALHAYQGVAGIIGSTIIGTLLMGVYLLTGSILAAIVLHALIDLRSLVLIPMIVYRVHRRPRSAHAADAPGRASPAALTDHHGPTDPSPWAASPLPGRHAADPLPGQDGDGSGDGGGSGD